MLDCSLSVVLGGLMGLLTIATTPVLTAAQQPADSIRAQARRDFHGPDMKGKDGPLAKAGLDLLTLYHEYRAFQKRGGDTFEPSVSGVRVANGHVTIDAVAAGEPQRLRKALTELGLKNAATAGQVVSGRFPITQIPALAKLESLRGVMPSRMQTQDDRSRTPPAIRLPDTSSQDRDGTGPPTAEKTKGADGEAGKIGVLLFLVALFAALGLAEL